MGEASLGRAILTLYANDKKFSKGSKGMDRAQARAKKLQAGMLKVGAGLPAVGAEFVLAANLSAGVRQQVSKWDAATEGLWQQFSKLSQPIPIFQKVLPRSLFLGTAQSSAAVEKLSARMRRFQQEMVGFEIQLPRFEFPAVHFPRFDAVQEMIRQLVPKLLLAAFRTCLREAARRLEDEDLDGFFELLKLLKIAIYPDSRSREQILAAFWMFVAEVVCTPEWAQLEIKETLSGYIWTCIHHKKQELIAEGGSRERDLCAIEPEIIDANSLKPWQRLRLEQLAVERMDDAGFLELESKLGGVVPPEGGAARSRPSNSVEDRIINKISRRELLARVDPIVTPTQREIIRLLGQGLSRENIAKELGKKNRSPIDWQISQLKKNSAFKKTLLAYPQKIS